MFTSEIERQRLGRNKDTVINRSVIDSGGYRRKFDNITDNSKLNRKLYQIAKKMLYHRSGTLYEDMYWIDLYTMEVFAYETDSTIEEEIIYSAKTIKAIQEHEHILTIHSHPNSFPPSINDFNSNYSNNYDVGIVICHDGTIFMYQSNEIVNENYFSVVEIEYRNNGYSAEKAQIMALSELEKNFDISYREVL